MSTELTDYETLAARFRPVFDRIAQGAAQRDHERILAYEPIAWLREARFGALRVPPPEYGGFGASIEQLLTGGRDQRSMRPQSSRTIGAKRQNLRGEQGITEQYSP